MSIKFLFRKIFMPQQHRIAQMKLEVPSTFINWASIHLEHGRSYLQTELIESMKNEIEEFKLINDHTFVVWVKRYCSCYRWLCITSMRSSYKYITIAKI